MSTTNSLRDRLAQYLPDRDTLAPYQAAIATYAFVIVTLQVAMGNLMMKTAKQAADLAKTLAVLGLVYATYYLVTEAIARPLNYAVERAVAAAASRGDLSDRAQNVLAIAIWAAVAYGMYRITKWAVEATLENLGAPNPSQTSVNEFLNGDDDDDDDELTEADINPNHPLYEADQ